MLPCKSQCMLPYKCQCIQAGTVIGDSLAALGASGQLSVAALSAATLTEHLLPRMLPRQWLQRQGVAWLPEQVRLSELLCLFQLRSNSSDLMETCQAEALSTAAALSTVSNVNLNLNRRAA